MSTMNIPVQEKESPGLERSLDEWLERIDGANSIAVAAFLSNSENEAKVRTAPGSREAHHVWEGGYAEHIRQTMLIVATNFELMITMGVLNELPEEEAFSLSDALTVMFLHDIEKPFMYEVDEVGTVSTITPMTKNDRKLFQRGIIERYGFAITPTMHNALKHVEGVRDWDYVPGERTDQPLAALCHAADNLSARGLYSYRGSAAPH